MTLHRTIRRLSADAARLTMIAAAILFAYITGVPVGRAQTPPTTQSLSLPEKELLSDCAALYRWQFGPQDPAYLKVKGGLDRLGGRSAKLQDVLVFMKRDAIQEAVAAGTFKMAAWRSRCADFLPLPTPSMEPRSAAFPEQPDPAVVSALSACLALQRWRVGTDTFETRDSIGVYVRYARTTEDAAQAQIKQAMDNLDKAIDNGLDPRVLLASEPSCLNDYHVIINGEPDQRHSVEYMKAHPAPPPAAVARIDPAPYTPPPSAASKRSETSPLWTGERLYTSGGVDVTDTQSSDECIRAMDDATVTIMPDMNRLTAAMERDKTRYCPSDGSCDFESNGLAVLACASVNRGRGGIPSQCLKERAIMENLREKVCPAN